jgi:hypothetical protein
MANLLRPCRFIVLSLSICAGLLAAVPANASAPPAARDALRARKEAARRYAGGAIALPDSAFGGGLRVCARDTPSSITGYWKVPAKVVDLIDADLMVYLRKSGIAEKLPFSVKLYVRQYAGFVHDGERMVYINAVLVEKGSPMAAEVQKAFPHACDAVRGSWGVQYDTKAKKFVSFSPK